jgi:hypothetical protein
MQCIVTFTRLGQHPSMEALTQIGVAGILGTESDITGLEI